MERLRHPFRRGHDLHYAHPARDWRTPVAIAGATVLGAAALVGLGIGGAAIKDHFWPPKGKTETLVRDLTPTPSGAAGTPRPEATATVVGAPRPEATVLRPKQIKTREWIDLKPGDTVTLKKGTLVSGDVWVNGIPMHDRIANTGLTVELNEDAQVTAPYGATALELIPGTDREAEIERLNKENEMYGCEGGCERTDHITYPGRPQGSR